MRSALADSLAHIHAVAAGHMNLTDFDVAEGLSEIRAHRVGPGVFGRYYDLVFAIQDRRHDDAGVLFREILNLASEQPILAVLPFTAEGLGAEQERYARLLSMETGSWQALAAPDARQWSEFETNVIAALKLLEDADAALAAELRALVIQIVGVGPAAQAGGRGFGGASSFMLWGAVLLSLAQHGTMLDMISGLVHEAAHQLLFGLSLDEALVDNSLDERYGSPLRTDPRPMDGIFHATFVCGRMHYAYARVRERMRNSLNQADRSLIEQRLREYHGKFFDGLDTVQRFGRMTANGDRIMNAAADYMRSAS
jgi:HEXXH motif-containing protein